MNSQGSGAGTSFLGARFANFSLPQATQWVRKAAAGEQFVYVVTPNVDHIVMLNDPGREPWREAYRAALAASDLTLNDSRILALLAGSSGIRLPVTPGSDLVREIVSRARTESGRLTLVGGRRAEADWLTGALPKWRISHFEPPMGVRDDRGAQDAIADFVEAERADIVLFAIGAPQSEIIAHAISMRGRARGVGLCIGASVEFLSGTKRRAPAWMQRAGLEWLFRLASEPGRLWRRYLLRGPRVFSLWWRSRRS